ncbi:MAG: bifunctional folylpolyglutamate synthase/dihydrofolate synthase [Lachnospiraceae bacterium]|nr:bifunctional folylpolyglutamate synthase/dihydrofolate synthase [Lachnospiraceae bacterium]
MTFQECVDYILSVPLFASKLGTENLNRILDIMGHPERSYPVIHVAGTNGKGSTCSFLASMLEQSGRRVGVFTSPHLITITERIRIGQEQITEEAFTDTFRTVMRYVESAKEEGIAHPSFFELVFLMAAVYFQKQQVDYAIFETGMGGRLDATNVVQPVLCIITSVGMDHMQYLGDTIEAIAAEKAGIIKEGIPVLFFDRRREATAVITEFAQKKEAKLYLVEKSQYNLSKIANKVIDFSFDSGYYRYCNLKIKQTGLYQIENAILAVKAYELLLNRWNDICKNGFWNGEESDYRLTGIDIDRIQTGLYNMFWSGRMEQVAENVYIDGAHNEEAIEAFCNTLKVLFPYEQKILLFAVSRDKDYQRMIEKLCEIPFHEIIIVRYEGSRAAELEAVEAAFRRFSGSKITTFDTIRAGFLYGKSHVEDQCLFCVGSLYLAGSLLSLGV